MRARDSVFFEAGTKISCCLDEFQAVMCKVSLCLHYRRSPVYIDFGHVSGQCRVLEFREWCFDS